jgi:hypothetical protein
MSALRGHGSCADEDTVAPDVEREPLPAAEIPLSTVAA